MCCGPSKAAAQRAGWFEEKGGQGRLKGWVAGGLWVCDSMQQAGAGSKQCINDGAIRGRQGKPQMAVMKGRKQK